jgi:hypothetical protein
MMDVYNTFHYGSGGALKGYLLINRKIIPNIEIILHINITNIERNKEKPPLLNSLLL